MDSKKPKIFKPNMDFVDNNKKAYYSYLEGTNYDFFSVSDKKNSSDVLGFIDGLSKGGSYIFNKNVIIVTKDKTYDCKIAGKIGNRIITLNNDSININDIIDIYEK